MEETGLSALSQFWVAGGSWMYPMLVLGLLAFALSMGLLSLSRRIVGLVPAILVAIALAEATMWQLGIRADQEAAAHALNASWI